MRRTLILTTLAATGMLAARTVLADAAPKTFELNNGRFTEVPTTQAAALPQPDPQLKQVERLIDQRQFTSARRLGIDWLLGHRGQPNYDLGLYLVAQALNGENEPLKAFYYCDELLDTQPASPYYSPALELQYQIGDSLFNGRKLKVLGVPLLGGTDEAIEMMFRLQQRSPGSPLAERALRRTADFYFADGQFDLAADADGALARSYPRSPNLPEVLLRQAFSNYAQFSGLRFDPTPLVNAREQLNNLIKQYPEIAARENLQSFVDAIDRTMAKKLFVTADYYRRTDKPEAARVTLQALVKTYPESDEAQAARKMLGQTKGPQ